MTGEKVFSKILPDTHATPDNGSWRLIWGLPILNKVRYFLWSSCQDAIPIKKNLRWQQILFEDIYDHYKQSSETVIHALWDCATLSGIWNSILKFASNQVRSFSTLCALFLFVHKEESRLEKWRWSRGLFGITKTISEHARRTIHFHRLSHSIISIGWFPKDRFFLIHAVYGSLLFSGSMAPFTNWSL